jgi:hypothetical protein
MWLHLDFIVRFHTHDAPYRFIGPPSVCARYSILVSCVRELVRVGLVIPEQRLADTYAVPVEQPQKGGYTVQEQFSRSAMRSEGFSGRSLRKLPFLAHALYIRVSADILNLCAICVTTQF